MSLFEVYALFVKTTDDIIDFIRANEGVMSLLNAVDKIQAPDCWVAAGAIRNPIWAYLHGVPFNPIYENDVDVIFFDRGDISKHTEKSYELVLNTLDDSVNWEVKNQARMHLRNDDAPYDDCYNALEYWAETPTAIGARIHYGKVEVIAPFGVDDLLNLIVQPTPNFHRKRRIYDNRILEKNWAEKWPKLNIL